MVNYNYYEELKLLKKYFSHKYNTQIYDEYYIEDCDYIFFRVKKQSGYYLYFFRINVLQRYKDSFLSNRNDDFIEDLTIIYLKYKRLLKVKN